MFNEFRHTRALRQTTRHFSAADTKKGKVRQHSNLLHNKKSEGRWKAQRFKQMGVEHLVVV